MHRRHTFLLAIALVTSNIIAVIATSLYWQFRYKAYDVEIVAMAVTAGNLEADKDYHRGIYRVYKLSSKDALKYTGYKEGPCEVWEYPVDSELGYSSILGSKNFVDAYNDRIRKTIGRIPETKPAAEDMIRGRS